MVDIQFARLVDPLPFSSPIVNFLDVTFDLNNGKFKPYRKPNDDPLYINRHSNHPPSIIKQLPTSINKRISALSADEQTFHESAPIYQNALRHTQFRPQTRLHEASTTKKHAETDNAISFGLTLHSAKMSKQTSHAIILCLIDKHSHLTTSYTRFSTETQPRSVIAA